MVSSAGIALWLIFARVRANKTSITTSPLWLAVGFGGVVVAVVFFILVFSLWVVSFALGGVIHFSVLLLVSFSILMVF